MVQDHGWIYIYVRIYVCGSFLIVAAIIRMFVMFVEIGENGAPWLLYYLKLLNRAVLPHHHTCRTYQVSKRSPECRSNKRLMV